MKNTMKSMWPVWQLPVRGRLIQGKRNWVHPRAKAHCFIGGDSLCGMYSQDTDFFETDIESGDIAMRPEIACKNCRNKWIKVFNIIV